MSCYTFGFETMRPEHVSPLHESSTGVHNALHTNDKVRSGDRSASASPSHASAAPSFIFTVDGSRLLTPHAATPHARRTDNANHNLSRHASRNIHDSDHSSFVGGKGSEAGGNRQGGRPPISVSNALSGTLPPAAATPPFNVRGVSCVTRGSKTEAAAAAVAVTRPASAGGPSLTSSTKRPYVIPASPSQTKPRFNNYVIGQSAATGGRVAALSQRPPRVPAAAAATTAPLQSAAVSQGTASSLKRSSSSDAVAVAPACGKDAPPLSSEGKANATPPPATSEDAAPLTEEAHTPRTTAASVTSQLPPAGSASASARPLLRRLPLHTTSNGTTVFGTTTESAQDETSSASDTGNGSAAPKCVAVDRASVSPETTNGHVRRPHIPPVHMTRTFALRRPVLLTKDTSAAAAVATSGSRKSTPRAAPGEAALEKNSESPPANRPAYVSERRRPSSSLSCSATRFLAYAPVPPPPSSSQPRRSRRTSLASMTSNSSTSLHQHRLSVAEEAAATRLFFYPMVSLTEAQTDDAENRKADAESGAAACDAVAKSSHEPAAVTNGDGSSSGLATRTSSVSVTSLPRRSDTDHQPPQQPRRSSRHLPGAYEPSHGVVERLRERGNAFMMREEFSQAIATYSEGIRLAPSCDALWGNRAAALLLTFRYLPAVADCLYVLSVKPGNVKAYWRAAKAYAAAYRFLDAKKYYLLAQQACMQERGRLHSVPSDGLSFSNGGLNVDSGCGGVPAGRPRTSRNSSGSGNDPQDGNKQDKAARERQSIAAERAAVEIVEQYWQHVRGERWPEAVAVIDRILATPSYTGPTAVSWRALRLEALLPTQPKIAMAEADALHRKYPDALELHYVLAKALFYTMQDAASTRKCLQLLDEATAKRSTQNTMLNTHVRYAVMQLRDNLLGEGGDTAAVQLEAWARRNQLRDDSRVAELRHTIDKFAHRRDQGNSAYDKGNWDAAAAAYTQCLQTDRLNHALLAAVYCNRTAVYMQAGRWREALSDADSAIQLSPHLATAYSRRGRILLYLLSQEYEAQRAVLARHFTTQWSTAVKEQLMRYADAAVADLSRAVELSPAAELRSQLQQALAQRQTVKAALCAPQPGNARQGRSTSFSSSGQAFPRTGNGSANGPAHQRSYAGSRPASATSAGCVLQQHLQLLGVKSSDATAGVLPDFKVVSKAYRESALRWHPDKWVTSTPQERQEAERQFKMISVAYTFLRERYNDRTVTS